MPEENASCPERRREKIHRTVKTASFSLFAAYAAAVGGGSYLKQQAPPDLLQDGFYHAAMTVMECGYGLSAGFLFYLLLRRKHNKAP